MALVTKVTIDRRIVLAYGNPDIDSYYLNMMRYNTAQILSALKQ